MAEPTRTGKMKRKPSSLISSTETFCAIFSPKADVSVVSYWYAYTIV
ncbi:MAG: hypothetical protein GWQ08_13505 [Verrucomicrobiaceae bacterium]|nr:hypothetical protein [Verrucomicrobiaceae bacterium]